MVFWHHSDKIKHHSMRHTQTEEHYSFGSSVMYSQTRVQQTNSKKTNTWITKQRSDCLWGCWRLICYWSVKHAGDSPASGSSDPGQQLLLCSFSVFLLQSVVSLPILYSKITPLIKFLIHWHLCYLNKFAQYRVAQEGKVNIKSLKPQR